MRAYTVHKSNILHESFCIYRSTLALLSSCFHITKTLRLVYTLLYVYKYAFFSPCMYIIVSLPPESQRFDSWVDWVSLSRTDVSFFLFFYFVSFCVQSERSSLSNLCKILQPFFCPEEERPRPVRLRDNVIFCRLLRSREFTAHSNVMRYSLWLLFDI